MSSAQVSHERSRRMASHRTSPANDAQQRQSSPESAPNPHAAPWYQSSWFLSLIGALLLAAAFPPLNVWPLAWIAPIPWLLLVRPPRLPGKRAYGVIYLAGLAHWLLVIHWIRLPHWSAYLGWLALALYLGVYVPLFIGLARLAVHRLRVPLVLAAPLVWTGLELVRGYMLTGFSMALLGHTQVDFPALIQIADLGGAYAVSFVVMLIAAALASVFPWAGTPRQFWPLAPAVGVLALALAYGVWRDGPQSVDPTDRSLHVALVQGCFDTKFEDPTPPHKMYLEYRRLTFEAIHFPPSGQPPQCKFDLAIWPESMFGLTLIEYDHEADLRPPPGVDADPAKFREFYRDLPALFRQWAEMAVRADDPKHAVPLLTGAEVMHFTPAGLQRSNSALFIDAQGNLAGRYDKMHPVMFGEYVPMGDVFPWLYRLTPMPGGLTPGTRPQSFLVAGKRIAPTICFENTVPHLVRRQIRTLARQGEEPDVLATVTNDGWFWGSSLLDMHLACGRFRAVENRKPLLIAANTGFSAWIDGSGRVLAKGPRHQEGVLLAEVHADPRRSLYTQIGDLPAGVCLLFCLIALAAGLWPRRN